MNERIAGFVEYIHKYKNGPEPVIPKYEDEDLFLPDVVMQSKRVAEYIMAQNVDLSRGQKLIGHMKFADGSYPSAFFPRTGHKRFAEVQKAYYCKPIDNLVTFEWQHSVLDYKSVIDLGMEDMLRRMEESEKVHAGEPERMEFLAGARLICEGIIRFAEKCAKECRLEAQKLAVSGQVVNDQTENSLTEISQAAEDAAGKNTTTTAAHTTTASKTESVAAGAVSAAATSQRCEELLKLAAVFDNIPLHPARNFYEAVQVIYLCFSFNPDSIGCIDRYLYPLYRKDIDAGNISREEAKELLQELFVMIQGWTPADSAWHTRGGESHFAIGGYSAQGEDGFNELSELIVEALMEMPMYIPQISFRWTKKTPKETLRKMLDCERKDKYHRIAFVNDEPRLKGLVEIAGLPYEEAVNYTMVGCNEPALPGSVFLGGCVGNIVRSLTTVLYEQSEEACRCESFDAFYELFEKELAKDIHLICDYSEKFNYARSKDTNVLSSIFFKGCIENAKSATRGGTTYGVHEAGGTGTVSLIDSLSIIRQYVYEEKKVTMEQLIQALKDNWEGHEELQQDIYNRGQFFGNHYELSDEIARKYTDSYYRIIKDRKSPWGFHYLPGCLDGYNQHGAWFGKGTKATPDGRKDGDPFMIGISQTGGKDREGLTALLSSVATYNPSGIMTGSVVTNVNVEQTLVKDDQHFEKLVDVIETYFKLGGLHIQMNYVTREELLAAKKNPHEHSSLRVRVSGFSEYFINLNDDLQNDVIDRTEAKLK